MVGVNSEVSSKHDITVMQIIVLSSNFRSRRPLVGNQFSKVRKDRNNVSAKVPKQCQFVVGGWNKTKRKLTSTHFGPILYWNTSKVYYKRLSLCSILTSQQISINLNMNVFCNLRVRMLAPVSSLPIVHLFNTRLVKCS